MTGRQTPGMAAGETAQEFITRHSAAIARVYGRSLAESWGVAPETLAEALYRGACSLASDEGGAVARYLDDVHAEDLAFAYALAAGNAAAWEEFVRRYRPALYGAGRAIVRDEPRARELADSLWAELYGIRGGKARRPLLDYFHGRSSLATWLHAVLARRHVDALRAERREQPLEAADPRELPVDPDPPNPDQARYLALIGKALDGAMETLKPRDRLRLAYHYGDGLTLKEIGALMDEREWTVSRRLKRSRESIRRKVERTLRASGLSPEAIRQCYDYALEGWSFALASGTGRPNADATKAG